MTTSKDVQFHHCRFAAWFEPGESQNMSISNCIVNALGRNRDTSTINIQNCIIFTVLNNLRATLKNNIIYRSIHGDYDLNIQVAVLTLFILHVQSITMYFVQKEISLVML